MWYLLLTMGVFFLDFAVKNYMDEKYALKTRHPRFKNKIVIEKYYNKGAAFNFLAKKPEWMKYIHTVIFALVGVFYIRLLQKPGRRAAKIGIALLTGGGLSNLYDRCRKGHVVDYFRINVGIKRFRRLIFNISDFFIFIGALLASCCIK